VLDGKWCCNLSFPTASLARNKFVFGAVTLAALFFASCSVFAETCTIAKDMDAATRTALTTAGQRYFDLLAKGDVASLRQASIPSLASDFGGVEASIKDNQSALAGSKATARPTFLLDAPGTAPITKAEFYCGVFGRNGQTADSAAFYLDNLPPGKYAIVILDVSSAKGPHTVSWILQQIGTDWKVGGLYIKASEIGGHNSDWFVSKARDYHAKGQAHNAWFYYYEARALIAPLPFMSTAITDKLYDESEKTQPADLPADGKTADLPSGPVTYKLTDIFPEIVNNELDLIVKYQVPDASNTNGAYTSNVAVMKALLVKYPELREAFNSIVARAVDASGRDYGTMLPTKDIK
jgi:hypothetical protein